MRDKNHKDRESKKTEPSRQERWARSPDHDSAVLQEMGGKQGGARWPDQIPVRDAIGPTHAPMKEMMLNESQDAEFHPEAENRE